jgi:hypothetical protein
MPVPTAKIFRRRVPRALFFILITFCFIFFAFPATTPTSLSSYLSSSSKLAQPNTILTYGDHGLAGNWTRRAFGKRIHPIEELMERGREQWKSLLKRQSKTIDEAVGEYRRRYGRNPPKGFDVWFKWAKENDVKIVDDVSLTAPL